MIFFKATVGVIMGMFVGCAFCYMVAMFRLFIEVITFAGIVAHKLNDLKIIDESQMIKIFTYSLKCMIKANFNLMIFHPIACKHCTIMLTYTIMDNTSIQLNTSNPIIAVHELLMASVILLKKDFGG